MFLRREWERYDTSKQRVYLCCLLWSRSSCRCSPLAERENVASLTCVLNLTKKSSSHPFMFENYVKCKYMDRHKLGKIRVPDGI